MAKRLFDILLSLAVLILTSPIMLTALFLVWAQDRHSPIFRARRVGLGNSDFTMMKIRSMRIGSHKTGVQLDLGGRQPDHVGRALHPPVQARRTFAILERAEGRHERGRP